MPLTPLTDGMSGLDCRTNINASFTQVDANVTAIAGKASLTGDTFTGPIVINGGTVTDSTPLLTMTQTWNDVNDAFSLLNIAVTNTASKAYSSTWADVSTLFNFEQDGETKLALIGKGSENFPMLRLGGSDADHILLKEGTLKMILRLSSGIDMVAMGFLTSQIGICVADNWAGFYKGVIGFNSTTNVMGGGNGTADAFFTRAGAAAAIQMGLNSATPIDQLFKGPNGSGTNIAAGDLRVAPGQSTGNATPATVVLQGTAAGSSGTTTQTLVDVLTIVREGVVRITNIPTSSAGLSTGDIYSNAGILTIV